MKWNGVEVRLAKHLGWRNSDPTKDVDLDGDPVESNYVSIVRIKDCRLYEKDGKTYYDPKNAPSIPINYGGTNYGYGKKRIKASETGIWIGDKIYHNYMTIPMYVVYDGKVYQGAIRRPLKEK